MRNSYALPLRSFSPLSCSLPF